MLREEVVCPYPMIFQAARSCRGQTRIMFSSDEWVQEVHLSLAAGRAYLQWVRVHEEAPDPQWYLEWLVRKAAKANESDKARLLKAYASDMTRLQTIRELKAIIDRKTLEHEEMVRWLR